MGKVNFQEKIKQIFSEFNGTLTHLEKSVLDCYAEDQKERELLLTKITALQEYVNLLKIQTVECKQKLLSEIQSRAYKQYLKDEKHLIFQDKGEVGNIAELGLICEELGEAMNGIRKKKGIENLEEECGDIISRTLCFMARNGIDAEKSLIKVSEKNEKRNRKGLFISTEV